MDNLTKYPGSAAGVARAISRLMRKHGMQMADTSNKYKWTAGYHVHRVGYSSSVVVDWNCEKAWSGMTPSAKAERAKRRDEMLTFLRERGYPINDIGWLECTES